MLNAPTIELAAPGSSLATRVRHARPQRDSGPMTPMAPTIPSCRKMGTAMATVPARISPADRAIPVVTTSASSARSRSESGASGGAHWARTSSWMSGGANASRALPKAPPRSDSDSPGGMRHAQWLARRHLVQARGLEPDPPDHDRRLAGLFLEQPEDRIRRPDQLFRGDVRPAPDDQLGPQPIRRTLPIDEAEVAERAQVAIDGRHRRAEQRGELVRADLAAIGDRQEDAQPTRERGVLLGLLGRSVTGGGHRSMLSPNSSMGTKKPARRGRTGFVRRWMEP